MLWFFSNTLKHQSLYNFSSTQKGNNYLGHSMIYCLRPEKLSFLKNKQNLFFHKHFVQWKNVICMNIDQKQQVQLQSCRRKICARHVLTCIRTNVLCTQLFNEGIPLGRKLHICPIYNCFLIMIWSVKNQSIQYQSSIFLVLNCVVR